MTSARGLVISNRYLDDRKKRKVIIWNQLRRAEKEATDADEFLESTDDTFGEF